MTYSGHDAEGWAGHFGAQFCSPSVRLRCHGVASKGVASAVSERPVACRLPFATTFSTVGAASCGLSCVHSPPLTPAGVDGDGQGVGRCVHRRGATVSPNPWNNMRRQTVLPSYRRHRSAVLPESTSSVGNTMECDISHDFAFEDGSSLVVHGRCASSGCAAALPAVRVFATDIPIPARAAVCRVSVVVAERLGADAACQAPTLLPQLVVAVDDGNVVVQPSEVRSVSAILVGAATRIPASDTHAWDTITQSYSEYLPPTASANGEQVAQWGWVERVWDVACPCTTGGAVCEVRLACVSSDACGTPGSGVGGCAGAGAGAGAGAEAGAGPCPVDRTVPVACVVGQLSMWWRGCPPELPVASSLAVALSADVSLSHGGVEMLLVLTWDTTRPATALDWGWDVWVGEAWVGHSAVPTFVLSEALVEGATAAREGAAVAAMPRLRIAVKPRAPLYHETAIHAKVDNPWRM